MSSRFIPAAIRQLADRGILCGPPVTLPTSGGVSGVRSRIKTNMVSMLLFKRSMIGLVFTPEQFKTLMRMIYIANTVANGHREEELLKDYDDLEQYIFSRAEAAGHPAAAWRHDVEGQMHHHPSRLFEGDQEIDSLMADHEMHAVVTTLAQKLAERDVEQKHGPRAKDRMSQKDYEVLFTEREEEYLRLLHAQGLKHVKVENIDG